MTINSKSNENDLVKYLKNYDEAPVEKLLGCGRVSAKRFFLKDIPSKFAKAHTEGYICIHNLESYDLATASYNISLDGILTNGAFGLDRPKTVDAVFKMMYLAIEAGRREGYKTSTIVDFDVALPLAFKYCFDLTKDYSNIITAHDFIANSIRQNCNDFVRIINTMGLAVNIACGLGVASLNHLGNDIASKYADILLTSLFDAVDIYGRSGLSIMYRVKRGVNCLTEGPHTEKAIDLSVKHGTPSYIFIDNADNDIGFDLDNPKSHIVMDDVSRLYPDLYGEPTSYSRGVSSCCTINLPRIGIISQSKAELFSKLAYNIGMAADQLQYRYMRQAKKRSVNAHPLLLYGVAPESKKCADEDISPMLKHFSLNIGFIGLYECTKALALKDIAIDGLEIVQYMYHKCLRIKANRKLNFALTGMPTSFELAYFTQLDRERYGDIPGVTDKEAYTGSFQIPQSVDMDITNRLLHESRYHRFCDGGYSTIVYCDSETDLFPIFEDALNCGVGYLQIY